ncbi:hypothetical protein C8F01DRAFT_1373383 [Mycena amicta]|nr:hypothetical protein C8F01DRAFT_1373383 [Mycena amicta]
MSFSTSAVLSESQRDAVISLGNVVRDSVHQDLSARDAFLVDSAQSILEYRPHSLAFIKSNILSESVFAIRDEMVRNHFRPSGPFGAVFSELLDFVGVINTGRRLERERQRAADERHRDLQAATDRRERMEALEYASNLAAWQDRESTISLSDGGCKTPADDIYKTSPSSPIAPDMSVDTFCAILSPIEVCHLEEFVSLSQLIAEMRLTIPTTPPTSPHPSLPDLVSASDSSESSYSPLSPSPLVLAPTDSRPSNGIPGSTRLHPAIYHPEWRRLRPSMSAMQHAPSPTSMPTVKSPTPLRLPPVVAVPLQPKAKSVGVWRASTPRSDASLASGSVSSGNFKPLPKKKWTRNGRRAAQIRRLRHQLAHALATVESHRAIIDANNTRAIDSCRSCNELEHIIRPCPALTVN